ncbi:aldo/keto reductase [Pedobacter psychrodurus]|uniref:Aldo/keto reductase n=1 Tax=Pedobacter psychrodurus TaxID=2530456 RepID=A0A4R0PYJ7_9SPHI|nr:aldo/keto reductase [Pedobacter psychrodurus]TCD26501.1 aldo/keto reductase [Pedobacter psychrodurus]
MNNKIFGKKCGLRVSEMVLGTGNFGTRWGYGTQADEAERIFKRYIDMGGNFIDTADGYQYGESEELLGRFIKGNRENLVLASKFSTGGSGVQTTGNSRKNIVYAVEQSLKRLQTDRLDIYWAHFSDNQTPIEEILRALDDLVRSGKILYCGFSNFPAWRIAVASLIADMKGWTPVIGIQIEYNLLERTADRELLPMADALGLGVAYWSPLAGGTLTGKYRNQNLAEESRKKAWGGVLVKGENSQQASQVLDALDDAAKTLNINVTELALAWLRQKDKSNGIYSCTIVGPRTLPQLDVYLKALTVTLPQEIIDQLNLASAVALGSPHETIAEQQNSIFGGNAIEIKHKVY